MNLKIPLNHIFTIIAVFFISLSVYAQAETKIFGTVSDQFGSLPGARVVLDGTNLYTTTDIEGNFVLVIPPGDYTVSVSFTMYKTVSKTFNISEREALQLNYVLETGFTADQDVSIDSRSIKSSLLTTSSPVDIVTAQDLANASQLELSQVLQFLVPSFHSAKQTISDGTDHVDPAAMRGLGLDQILVLVNGKRRHNSALLNLNGTVGRGTAGTDFNAIPVTSIDRIEILRDGATSQYGADAIAGVINIILKKEANEIYGIAKTSITSEGDGFTNLVAANVGFEIGEKGFLNATAEYRNREAINRAGDYTGTVYTNDTVLDNELIEENDFFEQNDFSGRSVMEIGTNASEDLAVTINTEIPVSKNTVFYGHGLRNSRKGKSRAFYRFPKDLSRVVLELYPNGFSPEIATDIDDNALFIGLKTVKNKWSLDFSHGIGYNKIGFNIHNSNNASLGSASPRDFYAGAYKYIQHTTNVDVNRPIDYFKGMNIAFGGELRKEVYEIMEGDEASYINGGETFTNSEGEEIGTIPGSQAFPGITPDNALMRSRAISSLYAEAEANLTDNLFLKGATRFIAGEDITNAVIWKVSSRYTISEMLGVRLGYSTGERAPSMHQLYFQNTGTQFISTGPAQIGTFNTESSVAEALGLGQLKSEMSAHFSAGFSGKVTDNITFSFNYYNIAIKDRIVLSGRISEGFDEILDPIGVDIAQVFTNALDSRTNGFDVTLGYQTSIGRGRFNTTFSGNITNTEVEGDIDIPEPLEGFEDVFFSREEIARVVSSQPRSKFISNVSYDINKLRFFMRNSYFGKVTFIFPLDGNEENFVINEFTGEPQSRDQEFSGKLLTDLSISYRFNSNLNVTLGGNNIFNVYPDRINHSALSGKGNFQYSRRVQQFNVNGTNYFLGFTIKI